MRFGAGIWLFGQFVDRYATDAYGPPVSTLEAIERAGAITEAEVERALGTGTVKLWPGQDGYDYPFQVDYREFWRLEQDAVAAQPLVLDPLLAAP